MTHKWWQRGVIYQIYPRSWADGNGDGVGDFAGILRRLEYLPDLGVDAIWISPFYPSPQADFGYDVSDFVDVDPVYGNLNDFDLLVSAAHELGLKLIIDWVPNHTSDLHPWFLDSRSSRDSAKRDWYVWRDPKPDGSLPNNWPAVFGGPAWEFDEQTGQYYLHSFLVEQPDLNWRNPEVEDAMLSTLDFWLDRGVDGFRMDVILRCMKDPLLRDLPPAEGGLSDVFKLDEEYARWDHIYDTTHPDIHGLLEKIRRRVDGHPSDGEKVIIGELHEFDWYRWASFFGRDNDELNLPFNFVLISCGLDPAAIRRAIVGVEASLPSGAWPNWVIGNHDEPRVTRRMGWESSKAAAVLLLTLRGTPTIYYGDEIGMLESEIPPELQKDPWGKRKPGFGRDGCRTPMQWDKSRWGGFGEGKPPWLPVKEANRISVEAEAGDPASHLELYRSLLRLRRTHAALEVGDIEVVGDWDIPNPLTYWRTLGDDRVFVGANLSDCDVSLRVEGVNGVVLAGTDPSKIGEKGEGVSRLGPWEAVVIGLNTQS